MCDVLKIIHFESYCELKISNMQVGKEMFKFEVRFSFHRKCCFERVQFADSLYIIDFDVCCVLEKKIRTFLNR